MKAPGANFDKSWRSACTVTHIAHEYADAMIRAHYLHKWPAVVPCVLGMWHNLFVVGTVVFALPPPEMAIRLGGETWELARLWVSDAIPRNAETWLLAQAVKHVRTAHPEIAYLVSYADPAAGHTGIIYRAANWQFDGMTDAGRKTPRCDYVAGGKKYGRKGHLPVGVPYQRVHRVSKYRYIYPLTRQQQAEVAA